MRECISQHLFTSTHSVGGVEGIRSSENKFLLLPLFLPIFSPAKSTPSPLGVRNGTLGRKGLARQKHTGHRETHWPMGSVLGGGISTKYCPYLTLNYKHYTHTAVSAFATVLSCSISRFYDPWKPQHRLQSVTPHWTTRRRESCASNRINENRFY